MNIKLFSLAKGEASAFAGSKKLIADCANAFDNEGTKFSNFASPKRMFIAVSQALRSADCIIIAVQNQSYNSIKKMLCSALELETQQHEDIYVNLLPLFEKGKISKNALINNSAFPVMAQIFPTDNLMSCGFAISSGSQSIIIIPLDPIKTAEVVFGSLYSYLGEKAGVEENEDLQKLKLLRLTERLFTALKKTKSTLAFAPVNGIDLIQKCAGMVDKNSEVFRFSQSAEARTPSQPVKDYIASCAQKTRIETKSNYAVAVSSAFSGNEDDSIFIYCAVSDKNETIVTKIFAGDEEDAKSLVNIGVEYALKIAGNTIIEKDSELHSKSAKATNKLRNNIITITAFALGGSAAICAILALLLGNG
ncbi:MAG: hypothetical protein IJZ88_07495 [Clostridia bacterium]|nr:hypothetical protein [Clostridia bacterium]